MYLLDTNICIYIINNRPEYIRTKLKRIDNGAIYRSTISFAELQYGAYKSNRTQESKQALVDFVKPFTFLDFTTEDAEAFGAIRAYLERKGMVIGAYDMQIAAQAMTRNFVLITNNSREVSRIPSLKWENWVEK